MYLGVSDPMGTEVLGEPRGKESSQQTRLAVGVAQDTAEGPEEMRGLAARY